MSHPPTEAHWQEPGRGGEGQKPKLRRVQAGPHQPYALQSQELTGNNLQRPPRLTLTRQHSPGPAE